MRRERWIRCVVARVCRRWVLTGGAEAASWCSRRSPRANRCSVPSRRRTAASPADAYPRAATVATRCPPSRVPSPSALFEVWRHQREAIFPQASKNICVRNHGQGFRQFSPSRLSCFRSRKVLESTFHLFPPRAIPRRLPGGRWAARSATGLSRTSACRLARAVLSRTPACRLARAVGAERAASRSRSECCKGHVPHGQR